MRVRADNPWKDVCEKKLELLFALLYAQIHAHLDWTRDYEGLDAELRKLTADVLTGHRIADRLIKAFDRHTGDPRYFHLEVQGKKERAFRHRVHIGNLRSEERFACHVTSLVILTDTNPNWRPRRYVSGCFPVERQGTGEGGETQKKKSRRYQDERTLRFMTVKLLDLEGREAELEADPNPLGLFLVAHLTALRTRKDVERRASVKLRLLLNLRERKMSAEDVQFWECCFDWLLPLRLSQNQAIWEHLQNLEKEQTVPFVSFAEKQGRIEGRQEGMRLSLSCYLENKYEAHSSELLALLNAVKEESRLQALCAEVFAAENVEGIRAALLKAQREEPASSGA